MNRTEPVINPTRYQLITLRFMVLLGVFCMFFFYMELLTRDTDNRLLYWMLMLAIGFACLRTLYEWIHYLFITVPKTPLAKKTFTVDVFTTFCAGEPYDMIKETLIAIQAIRYPHNTYLCDEADDPYLKQLCLELGVNHVTRKVKIDAKAGNINNALKISSGELCLILDPDHVPFPEFLDQVVSHFEDPEIGFVQVVQSYKNQDQTLIAKGAAQQTYQFYGPMMMTMNKYGTVLAIGANCTFRREALDSIGGHAAGLAEDMHTAMQLHAKGWKSKYVPAVVARGLVPVTLSAYYSQQLKWARGVFELLVTSYPRLFRKFTWQQKLHYGTIPLFYLSGLFYFINFFIPPVSLIFNTSPINIDFTNFLTLGLPLITSVILIRHFVQKWVMEEEERGFHAVGGLLMIGTWWVFTLGFYYTLLRKKVPYIPTPKDGHEDNNWHLSIPNLAVITISFLSIIYGLYNDWNPYNLIMAGFAATNCVILSFTVVASRQTQFRKYKAKHPYLMVFMTHLAEFKVHFWKARRRVYSWVRSSTLIIVTMVACFTLYRINSRSATENETSTFPDRKNILISGIFAPQADGLSSMKEVKNIEQQSGMHFGIVSLYLSWGDQEKNYLPGKLLDSIYNANAIPMITWEPWQSLFEQNLDKTNADKERKVFSRIINGDYDHYLDRFSKQLKSLNRPVFIRFAHEADNPQYPWSASGENTPEEFIAAWKYVHEYFTNKHTHNVVWVWNPWRAEAVGSYFPGKAYVDWIGITMLNYAHRNPDKQWYNMHELYESFHRKPQFKMGLPVMLAETGSLRSGSRQKEWFLNTFRQIEMKYPEIKALVFFNSGKDKNITDTITSPLDWRVADFNAMAKVLNTDKKQSAWYSNRVIEQREANKLVQNLSDSDNNRINSIKGVNYSKDQNWRISHHTLKKDEIVADFTQMKQIGVNTIKHFGPNIYDHNILGIAGKQKLNVVYSFWLPESNDFVVNIEKLNDFANDILKTINKLKANKSITMWNISNTPLMQMEQHFYKPDLFYPREAYLSWLNKLVSAIKKADPQRAVNIDLDVNSNLATNAQLLQYSVPQIDHFGLVTAKVADTLNVVNSLKRPYFYSKIGAEEYLKLPNNQIGVFISNWQDQHTNSFVSFDGLKDISGNNKTELYRLGHTWNGLTMPSSIPLIKILKPAMTIQEGHTGTYYALYEVNGNWQFIKDGNDLKFEWYLVRSDRYKNPIQIRKIGEGNKITLRIPAHPKLHQLYLYVIKGKQVKIVKSNLNTPLVK